MKSINNLLFFCVALIVTIIFHSCTKVTWAAFTTPKDNIENVPKVLEQYLGSPATNKIRMFEYDQDKFMGLFIFKNFSMEQVRASAKTMGVNIILPSDIKLGGKRDVVTTAFTIDGYQFFQYKPAAKEDEFQTAYYLMETVNKLKKNKTIEVYSQTNPSLTRQFLILNK